ncbi:MAG: hypothetical protein HYV26_05055, partial [Candidatus Hydrogenedentes bacterium]|nr:hypothetical protein [Candidatus Hydrogenedentota bacterium]
MKYVPLALTIIAGLMVAAAAAPGISGQYLEFRSCDVYTGPCFANGEMDLSGKEAILVWAVDRGAWNGVT